MAHDPAPTPTTERPVAAAAVQRNPDDRRVLTWPWFESWLCILVTVFLSGAAVNCLFRWLPYGRPWDLGGAILSGMMAWASYRYTLSEKPSFWRRYRFGLSVVLLVAWLLVFPTVMVALGFSG